MAGNHSNTSVYAQTPKLPNIPAERCRRVGRPWIWTGASNGHKDVLSIEDGVIPAKKTSSTCPPESKLRTYLPKVQADGIESHSRRNKDDNVRASVVHYVEILPVLEASGSFECSECRLQKLWVGSEKLC